MHVMSKFSKIEFLCNVIYKRIAWYNIACSTDLFIVIKMQSISKSLTNLKRKQSECFTIQKRILTIRTSIPLYEAWRMACWKKLAITLSISRPNVIIILNCLISSGGYFSLICEFSPNGKRDVKPTILCKSEFSQERKTLLRNWIS